MAPPDGWRQFACDLTTEPLADVLQRATGADGKDERPTVISWLGVTQYLTLDAISISLAGFASAAPGAEVVLTTLVPDEFVPEEDLESVRLIASMAAANGEPFLTHDSNVSKSKN